MGSGVAIFLSRSRPTPEPERGEGNIYWRKSMHAGDSTTVTGLDSPLLLLADYDRSLAGLVINYCVTLLKWCNIKTFHPMMRLLSLSKRAHFYLSTNFIHSKISPHMSEIRAFTLPRSEPKLASTERKAFITYPSSLKII